MSLITLKNVKKEYGKNQVLFENLSLEIEKGEFVGLVGKSGAGKTTLLNIIGLITDISEGTITIDGHQNLSMNGKNAMILRRYTIGYLFQNYGLIEDESVLWNLKLALEYKKIKNEIINLQELSELVQLEPDEEIATDILKNSNKLQKEVEKFEISTFLSGKYDQNNAIITIHPGAGGTESQDWAEMLYRMYTRWANKTGYTVKELDYLEGEEAGIKSVTFEIIGENAYGYMKCEMGVHRLVRISPFDSGGRRHTSFASIEVLPEITDDIEIEINPDDLRIDTYRASRSRRTAYKQDIFCS